jgi:hypothetical protein
MFLFVFLREIVANLKNIFASTQTFHNSSFLPLTHFPHCFSSFFKLANEIAGNLGGDGEICF